MEIRLLGPVEVHARDTVLRCSRPQETVALAMLAERAGRPVAVETLIAGVWADDSPPQSTRMVNTHITRIRRLLEQAAMADGTTTVGVARWAGGYTLDIAPEHVDLHHFRGLLAQAEQHEAEDPRRLGLLRQALVLWRGEPLTGLRGSWVEQTRHTWNRQRQAALLAWGQAELRVGDQGAVVSVLTTEVAKNRLVEPMVALLMQALARTGRSAEAAQLYAVTCRHLAEELGMDPGAELRALHQALLRGELATDVCDARPAPRQLPADVPAFTGREQELAQLDGVLAGPRTTVVISAVSGTAGIGKTALAVHWAHRNAAQFPDGQLYVNLGGFGPGDSVMDPADAIRGFLDALAVPAERVPADPDTQSGLYRTLLADRRMLVVLDNARDTAQVQPLLPGAPGCLVLVTSRNRLTGLVAATGAHTLPLDLLTAEEARHLLVRRLGPRRTAAEADAVDTLITYCAGLPLALAVVAARAATQPALPLGRLAGELHDTGTRLEALADHDPNTDLRIVFSWSYGSLSAPAQRLFRLLGLHPGPDISTPAAASLAALSANQTRGLLAELTHVNLINERASDTSRYTIHDLLRAYAVDLTRQTDTAAERLAAVQRVLDHYLHTAYIAGHVLMPTRDPIPTTPAAAGAILEHPTTVDAANSWFTTERNALLAALDLAATSGLHDHTWRLAWSLYPFLALSGRWRDRVHIGLAAVVATQQVANPALQANAHRQLALAYIALGDHTEARSHLHHALGHAQRANDLVGQADVHHNLAQLIGPQGRHHEAVEHVERALDLYTRAGHHHGKAQSLNGLGWLHSQVGEHHLALTYCERALQLYREHGHMAAEADAWDSLGYIHHQLGDHPTSIDCYQRALALFESLGAQYYRAVTLVRLGDTHRDAGNSTAARDAWQQALAIFADIHHPDIDKLRTKVEQLDEMSADRHQ